MGAGVADERGACGDGAASGFFFGATFLAAWAAAAGEGDAAAGEGDAAFGAAGEAAGA